MDIHQLKLFLAVMDSRSMTHAAQRFHLSPGAVSLQLHSLSDELHAELFVRSGQKLVPTPAAFRLADHAKEVIRWTSVIQQEFADDVSKRCASLPVRHWRYYSDSSAGPATP